MRHAYRQMFIAIAIDFHTHTHTHCGSHSGIPGDREAVLREVWEAHLAQQDAKSSSKEQEAGTW